MLFICINLKIKKTKQTYNIEFDEANSIANKTASNPPKKSNVNIKIPDVISTATSSYRHNTYQTLNDQDNSDSEVKKPTPFSSSLSHSNQMQHEVNYCFFFVKKFFEY
jgi:hypothetical protein